MACTDHPPIDLTRADGVVRRVLAASGTSAKSCALSHNDAESDDSEAPVYIEQNSSDALER